ncbi:MAG: amidohydrolase [Clostridia bacterium]|nr:amidohydrolase [Clostridia bacterium]
MKDTLIYGNIITMDPERPRAEALGMRGGKVAFVGSREEAGAFGAAEVIDLGSRTVMPGFIDTHVHVIPSGIFMTSADLSGAADLAEVLIRLEDHAAKVPGKGWVLGAFFQDKLIKEKRFPTRAELDAISRTKPILLCHNDLHPIALNSRALEILKVKPGAEGICVDENGELTGIIEDPACVNMLGDILAKLGIASILDGIIRVDDYAVAHGVTTVFGKDVLDVLLLTDLARDLLKAEFIPMWYSDGCRDIESIQKIAKNRSPRLRKACVCAFADGSFDAHSAATAEPYADRPDTCGILNYTDDEMYDFTMAAHREGLQVSFHAIGDAAVDQVLRVYERVLRDCPREDHRLRIEHFEEPTKEAIAKAAELKVALAMQPLLIEVCERMDFSGYTPFIGDRVRRCSPYRSVLDAGILVGGGTDFTVTPMDVLHGARICMTHPVEEERITLEECLKMNTCEAAKLGFLEDRKGRVAPGLDADLVVLDRDPYEAAEESVESLSDIKVLKTFRSGVEVYDSETFRPSPKRSLPGAVAAIAAKKIAGALKR